MYLLVLNKRMDHCCIHLNKQDYDLRIMGNLVDGNAGVGSTFFQNATDNEFINSKDILKSLTEYLECLQEQLRKQGKMMFDSFESSIIIVRYVTDCFF